MPTESLTKSRFDVEVESKDEVSMSPSDVPQIVIDAVKLELPYVRLKSAEVEQQHRSGLVYELEGDANGSEYELEITESGKVIEVGNESDDDDED